MADKKKPVRPPSRTAGLLQLPLQGVPKMSQGLLSYEPTLREKIANAVYDGSVGLLGKRKAHEMQANTKSAVDFVPGLGDAVGANDMARDYRAGNYGMAALSAIGLIPAVGDVASKVGKKALANAPEGIRAFHGSPHSFDKFSLDKIGTGEGAQAYGHGLYFADNEGVAKSYREGLSIQQGQVKFPRFAGMDLPVYANTAALNGDEKTATAANMFKDFLKSQPVGGSRGIHALNFGETNVKDQLGAFKEQILSQKVQSGDEFASYYDDALEGVKTLEKYADIEQPRAGSMYEVNIRANPDDFLDWDKPLSEQPENIRRKLGWTPEQEASYKAAQLSDDEALLAALTGDASAYKNAAPTPPKGLPRLDAMGADIARGTSLFDSASDVEKSRRLKEAGIPGIKYLDAGSRGAGDGSRNYVVFDEKLIDIVRKYGLASAIGAGIISKEMGQQMQAQGDI